MRTRSHLGFGAALVIAWAGCQSPSQYISPRISGRVVDEITRQPIRGVRVQRVLGARPSMEPPKGGQLMKQPPSDLTGADGGFVMKSERSLAFFRRVGWYSVTLSFTHPGHEHLKQTYTLSGSTNTSAGEPLIQTGDILLKPRL